MEMESLEKSLKSSFVGTANTLTQMYTNSLNCQKQAYVLGYTQSNRDTLEYILKNVHTKKLSVDHILEYLKMKLEESGSPKTDIETDVQIHPQEPTQGFKFNPTFGSDHQNPPSDGFNAPHFIFSAPAQTQHLNQPQSSFRPQNSSMDGFNYIPPPSVSADFFVSQSHHTNPSHQMNPSNSEKKRTHEIQQSSMDYYYPDPSLKKSKVHN